MTRGALAWPAVAALLGACALLGLAVPRESIDWQPALAATEPWRAFTAVAVHYSDRHLAGNLAGALLAAVFGVVAQAPPRLALAWLAAWPLTHLALLVEPRLGHYGGLSGVLHAGAAAVIVWLLVRGAPAQRWVAGAVGLGLVAKLLAEAPWGEALRYPAAWDIAVAPIAHATGVLAGAACAVLALRIRPARAGRTATASR